MNALESLLSAAEAAALWKLDESTLRRAIKDGRYPPDQCRKFGKQWIVTYTGMEAAFGPLWTRGE